MPTTKDQIRAIKAEVKVLRLQALLDEARGIIEADVRTHGPVGDPENPDPCVCESCDWLRRVTGVIDGN